MGVRSEVARWLRGAMAYAKIPTQQAMADKAIVSRETVNNLLNEKVDADPDTLMKLATACGVPVPTVEWRFSAQGGPQNPLDALGWVREAQASLERAAGLLRPQPTEQPPAPPGPDAAGGRAGRAIVKASKARRGKPSQPPGATQPKKAG